MEKVFQMSEPAQECENNANFKQIYLLKLFIAFKMADSCCFSLGDINYCSEVYVEDLYSVSTFYSQIVEVSQVHSQHLDL